MFIISTQLDFLFEQQFKHDSKMRSVKRSQVVPYQHSSANKFTMKLKITRRLLLIELRVGFHIIIFRK